MAEYIKKEAVIKFIENGLNNPDKTKSFGHDAIEIMAEVQYMPAADVVEVRHGKWIKTYPDNRLDGDYYCSNCYAGVDIATGEETPIDRELYYCPNCGAKMDGATDTNVGGKLKEGAEE